MVEFRISTDEKVSKCDNLDIDELQLVAKIQSKYYQWCKKLSAMVVFGSTRSSLVTARSAIYFSFSITIE
jgi:hypothetical protein